MNKVLTAFSTEIAKPSDRISEEVIKRWTDIYTAGEESERMLGEYKENGFIVQKLLGPNFEVLLKDGKVMVLYDAERKVFTKQIVQNREGLNNV
ncbi:MULTISPECIES: hypothetical protein [unclassified Breznakia]|uniref:hypothetical protein n=1 Tax=unclassified Breznakia TaxID=2623764 RepID=UPI002475771F|nr:MULTISPECIES: hypothetical protein [unclassified Breznakia]MDH6367044.1 hypothetical protein [Breznakia sp. PH1-1]MDH6404184.1 hypothetical protein [Breznakia sp. PF1-11]MDH6411931.1 hypothetical protein [Breznakia sp. PFB1-11]MDH6414172.1 hypothetical protein [Breznakia sp. PFB1-14]MDH6418925.1 hypothetical protein [Breznakia sp. PFB1-12]